MYVFFFLFFILNIENSQSYFFTNFFKHNFFNKFQEFNINHYNDFLKNNIKNDYTLNKIQHINMNIFNKVTEYLPELHKSGDSILVFNKKIINIILHSDLSDSLKKNLIINLIDLTLAADHAASHFLDIYQNFVHHIM